MKRVIMILAALSMSMFLGACGQKEPKAPEVNTSNAAMDQKQEEQAPAVAPAEEKKPAAEDSTSEDNSDKSASVDGAVAKTADASDTVAAPADSNTQAADAPAKDENDDENDEEEDTKS